MSNIKMKLKSDMTQAMKSRDATRLQTLRMALSAIQKKEIDISKDLIDVEVEKVLLTMIKQLQETIEQAKSLGRNEKITDNENEIAVLREYLPKMLGEAEVQKIVEALKNELSVAGQLGAGAAGMGVLMKATMAKVGSSSDGKTVQAAVKKVLGL